MRPRRDRQPSRAQNESRRPAFAVPHTHTKRTSSSSHTSRGDEVEVELEVELKLMDNHDREAGQYVLPYMTRSPPTRVNVNGQRYTTRIMMTRTGQRSNKVNAASGSVGPPARKGDE